MIKELQIEEQNIYEHLSFLERNMKSKYNG